MQPLIDTLEVAAHGVETQVQFVGNLLVCVTLRNQEENPLFAEREPGGFILNGIFPPKRFDTRRAIWLVIGAPPFSTSGRADRKSDGDVRFNR